MAKAWDPLYTQGRLKASNAVAQAGDPAPTARIELWVGKSR
jgi:hypothetical protein